MNIQEYIRSQSFKGILIGFCLAILVLLVFQAGVAIGYRKATFNQRFGDSYYRAFDSRPGRFAVFLGGRPIAEHGAVGNIVSIDPPTFVVAGPDNIEKVVLVGKDTLIRHFDTDITAEELKVGDFTVVLGEPNENSQVEAKLIRILPPPPGQGLQNP